MEASVIRPAMPVFADRKPLAQAHKGEIGRPPGAQGMLPTNPRDWGKSLQNYFLRGFGGKLACPKASWVTYKPFGSRETQCSQTCTHFQSKLMFFGGPVIAQILAQAESGARSKILDQNVGPRSQMWSPGLKISKLRLETTCWKQWSILQTEPCAASYDPKPFWGMRRKNYAQCGRTKSI